MTMTPDERLKAAAIIIRDAIEEIDRKRAADALETDSGEGCRD